MLRLLCDGQRLYVFLDLHLASTGLCCVLLLDVDPSCSKLSAMPNLLARVLTHRRIHRQQVEGAGCFLYIHISQCRKGLQGGLTQNKSDESLTETKEEANNASEQTENVGKELCEQAL